MSHRTDAPAGLDRFWVLSPEYETHGGGEYEPPEYGADCIEIEAENARDAVMLGVAEIMRTQRHSWAQSNREDNLPPWAGYRAERFTPEDHACAEADDARH